MSDKYLKLDRRGYDDVEAIEALFPGRLTKRFLAGVLVGMLVMAALDLSDMHVCVGECDGVGFDLRSGTGGQK